MQFQYSLLDYTAAPIWFENWGKSWVTKVQPRGRSAGLRVYTKIFQYLKSHHFEIGKCRFSPHNNISWRPQDLPIPKSWDRDPSTTQDWRLWDHTVADTGGRKCGHASIRFSYRFFPLYNEETNVKYSETYKNGPHSRMSGSATDLILSVALADDGLGQLQVLLFIKQYFK